MKQLLIITIVQLSLLASTATAGTNEIEVNIGGVRIDINSPDGFHEISALSPAIRSLMESLTPPTNRLLGVFVSEQDLGRVMKNEELDLNRYMLLQTNRSLETTNLTSGDFRQIATQLKQQQATLLQDQKARIDQIAEKASKDLSDEYMVSMDMKVGQQMPLGVFNEKSYTIALAHLGKYEINIKGAMTSYVMAHSTSFVLVKKRLLYAYVYSGFEGQDDIDWVRSKTAEWVESIRN